MRYRVFFEAGAGTSVEVESDVDLPVTSGGDVRTEGLEDEQVDVIEDLMAEASMKLNTTLCHQCAGKVDLGDFEAWDRTGSPIGIILVED